MKSFHQLLSEMPLQHYDAKGKSLTPESGLFDKRDIIIVNHPSTERILREVLSKFAINFIFLIGHIKDEEAITEYLKRNGIDYFNSIVFCKFSSSGGKLTPWMILHCFGHAVEERETGSGFVTDKVMNLISLIAKGDYTGTPDGDHAFISRIYRHEKENKLTRSSDMHKKDVKNITHLGNIFGFKSIKNIEVTSLQELTCELIAEFLWHGGKIRYNEDYINENFENSQEIISAIHNIEDFIFKKLNSLKGKIITD